MTQRAVATKHGNMTCKTLGFQWKLCLKPSSVEETSLWCPAEPGHPSCCMPQPSCRCIFKILLQLNAFRIFVRPGSCCCFFDRHLLLLLARCCHSRHFAQTLHSGSVGCCLAFLHDFVQYTDNIFGSFIHSPLQSCARWIALLSTMNIHAICQPKLDALDAICAGSPKKKLMPAALNLKTIASAGCHFVRFGHGIENQPVSIWGSKIPWWIGNVDPQLTNLILWSFMIITGWWFQPLWKIWKSFEIIIPNIWKIIQMFQTTNQYISQLKSLLKIITVLKTIMHPIY